MDEGVRSRVQNMCQIIYVVCVWLCQVWNCGYHKTGSMQTILTIRLSICVLHPHRALLVQITGIS